MDRFPQKSFKSQVTKKFNCGPHNNINKNYNIVLGMTKYTSAQNYISTELTKQCQTTYVYYS